MDKLIFFAINIMLVMILIISTLFVFTGNLQFSNIAWIIINGLSMLILALFFVFGTYALGFFEYKSANKFYAVLLIILLVLGTCNVLYGIYEFLKNI